MATISLKRALVSVYDKAGLVPFCSALVNEFGIELISTGGTARTLREAGLVVTDVSAITGFPEMLDGRVKTLHPLIHAAILADRSNAEHMRHLREQGAEPIDLVIVNLYPFEATAARPGVTHDEVIEHIDIGGPTLLRAAAKNYHHGPAVLADVARFGEEILDELRERGDVSLELREELAGDVWDLIEEYDLAIYWYFANRRRPVRPLAHSPHPQAEAVRQLLLKLADPLPLRYGENSHQQGSLLRSIKRSATPDDPELVRTLGWAMTDGIADAQVLQGELGYNNWLDADAAYGLVRELSNRPNALLSRDRQPAPGAVTAIIKHTNACGVGVADSAEASYEKAYLGDPISAAGGVLCMNYPVTRDVAHMVMSSYQRWGKSAGAGFFKLDVWIAPQFDADAIELITTPTEKRKWGAEVRLLALGEAGQHAGRQLAPVSGEDGPRPLIPDPPSPTTADQSLLLRSVSGGLLVQSADDLGLNESAWMVATSHQPTPEQWADLRLAWLICKHQKSNAITICLGGQMLGAGVGQTSRVMSCRLAVLLAKENGHARALAGSVAASDAFFPVPDGPKHLIDAGVKAIIHPGGSTRDAETVALCEAAGVSLVVTGTRHFRH